jgi:probable rRNA maturation factor
MTTSNLLEITNATKGKLPRLPFLDIKNAILGETYDLSIAFVGKTTSKKLNTTYRQKEYATNVLSFPNSKKSGEIVLCPDVMKKEMKFFGMTMRTFTAFLVIHGMLHLKGLEHGSTMETAERKYMKQFGFSI